MTKVALFALSTLTLAASAIAQQFEPIIHEDPITLEAAQKEYKRQIDLARKEGIPITFAEVAAQITPVTDDKNAAPFYQKLNDKRFSYSVDTGKVLGPARNPKDLDQAAAKALLQENSEHLQLIESGADLPGCDFHRDWTKGYALLFPELSNLKAGANLLSVRAHLGASQSDHKSAVRDVRRMTALARHSATDPLIIPRLVANSIQTIAAREAVDLAIYYPEEAAYKTLLADIVASWPQRQPQKEMANDFPGFKDMIDNADNRDYFKSLGLPDEETPKELVVGTPAEQLMAKADMIAYFRRWHDSYTLPQPESLHQAMSTGVWMNFKMAQFPAMRSLLTALMPEIVTTRDRFQGPVQQLAFRTAHRAISARNADGTFPKSIQTDDLVVPYVNLPMQYESDGKSFTVSVFIPGHELFGGEETFSYTFPRVSK